MKTLMYCFVMALIVMAGCAKEDTMLETQDNLELKKAKVPIPFKADCYAFPDFDSAPILISPLDPADPKSYTLSRLFIGGTGSHLGRIDESKSYYHFESVTLIFEDGVPYTIMTGTGLMVGANGDAVKFSFQTKQSQVDGIFTGTGEVIEGTGRFKGCVGSTETYGKTDWEGGTGIWFKSTGYLFYE